MEERWRMRAGWRQRVEEERGRWGERETEGQK